MEKLRRLRHRRATRRHATSHGVSKHTSAHSEHKLPPVQLETDVHYRNAKSPRTRSIRHFLSQQSWKRIALFGGAGIVVLLLLVQLFYPSDRLLGFSRIDGRSFAWQKKSDVVASLDTAYEKYPVQIYMTGDEKPVTAPTLSDIDTTVNNAERLASLDYPWYLRIIPTSLFWAGLREPSDPKVSFGNDFGGYVDKKLMPNCKQSPVNATLRAEEGKLLVVDQRDGRTCARDDVTKSIKQIHPQLNRDTSVHVGAKIQPADVTADELKGVARTLNDRIGNGVQLDIKGQMLEVPATEVAGWLDFTPHDDTVDSVVNTERATVWLNANVAPKLAVQPGTSYVTTRDFTELSRVNGASGQAIDIASTVASLQQVVVGAATQASAGTKTIPPNEQYTRTYSPSDQGLSALLANYAKDHSGTFGISLIELDGKKRRADFQGDKQFVTASTYKLFVAYSLLKQIDAGKRDWESNASCFNKMISNSDNPCSEAFLQSLGLSNVTKDIQAIGLKNSTFMKSGGPFTTANDLTLLLGMIATGQNFSSANQQRLIAAMKANVYRNGIPAGASGQVADKVGFLNGLLHDAAIVYSPKGTYVLAIMTDGSSWATIADLTRQIDALRAQ